MADIDKSINKDKIYFETEPSQGINDQSINTFSGKELLGGNNSSESETPAIKFSDISFTNESQSAPEIDSRIDKLITNMRQTGVDVNPLTTEYFYEPDFYNALPIEVKDNDQLLTEYIDNTGKFADLLSSERQKRSHGDRTGLFGEEIQLTETEHSDGKLRRAEKGYKINIDYLTSVNIDPQKVLFFRVTQPMEEQPKQEYYWTSDYFETVRGLTREIPPSQRETAIIIVADMQTINENGGLIQDINDDSGLAVRQIANESFDQQNSLTQFPAKSS